MMQEYQDDVIEQAYENVLLRRMYYFGKSWR